MIFILLFCTILSLVLMITEAVGERDWPRDTAPAFFSSLVFLLLYASI